MAQRRLSPVSLLVLLTGLNLVNYVDRSVLMAVRTPLAADFGLNYGDSGRVATAFMIGYFLTSPFFGFLGDRFSRKWLIALGIFVWSLGTVLTGYATGFGMLLAYRVLVGVGEASYATISPSLISDAFTSTRRNTALTIFYVAIPVGSALGYLLGGEVYARWGWRHAFIFAGAPGLFLALVMLPFAEPRRGEADLAAGQTVERPRWSDYVSLWRNPSYQLVVWGYVAYTFALGAFAFWGPSFLEQIHDLRTEQADRFFGLALVGTGLTGTLLGGLMASSWRKRSSAAYAWVLFGSVLLAIPVCFGAFLSGNLTQAKAMLIASMFLLFLPTGPVNTLILETVPVNLRASAMALSIFLIHLFGDMWSPELVGRAADFFGHDLRRGVLVLPAMLVLCATLWLVLALRAPRVENQSQAAELAKSG